MSITVSKYDGTQLVILQDGVIDTDTSSINLLGRNYVGYSDKIADNFIWLMENFANSSEPHAPLEGQLWYDTTNAELKVYNTTIGWKILSFSNSSTTAPSTPNVGDLWFDTTNQQLNVWTGTAWLLIGPITPSGFGFTGTQVAVIQDTLSNSHRVGEVYVDGNLITIVSQDATFTPSDASLYANFGNILPGYNLTGNLPAKYWNGIAINSTQLNSLSSTDFLRANIPALTTSSITIQSDTGLTVGLGLDFTVSVNNIDVSLKNNSTNGNLNIVTGNTTAIAINGTTFAPVLSSTYGNALVANSSAFSSYAVATVGYVSAAVGGGAAVLLKDGTNQITGVITPDVTLARDFGTTLLRYNTVYVGNINASANIFSNSGSFSATTQSTSPTTGAVIITGGLGVGSNLYVGGNLAVSSPSYFSANIITRNILPVATNAYDIGSPTNTYRYIYGTASYAQYADLAEKYTSDDLSYDEGTVVIFGGEQEITTTSLYGDNRLAGVISRSPAYLMNANGDGLAVALKGKVLCKVTGKIYKGQMLTSSTIAGVAQVAFSYIGGAIIGKSLEDADFGGGVGKILVAVGSI